LLYNVLSPIRTSIIHNNDLKVDIPKVKKLKVLSHYNKLIFRQHYYTMTVLPFRIRYSVDVEGMHDSVRS
jgi:hypothetical protein